MLRDQFTELHEGLEPSSIRCERYKPVVRPVQILGRITEIQYKKKVTDGSYSYWHPFKNKAQPSIGIDREGHPVILAGRYRVTTAGIVDRSARSIQKEHLPATPKSLSNLGTLESIKYSTDPDAPEIRTLRFSGRTTLAHDDKGHLHILDGKLPSGEIIMAKGRRRNPSFMGKNGLVKKATPLVAAGAVGAVASILVNRFLPPRITGYKRAGIQAGGGLALALVATQLKLPASAALGVGVVGIASGVVEGVQEFQLRQAARQPTGSMPPTSMPGGGYALGPGGLPQGYYGVNRAGCAVSYR